MITEKKYNQVHKWLRDNFGQPQLCEGKVCSGRVKRFQWALIKGKTYDFDRDNFMRLCASCHTTYDNLNQNRGGVLRKTCFMRVTPSVRDRLLEMAKERETSIAEVVNELLTA